MSLSPIKKNKPLPINNSGTQSYDKQHHNLEIQESQQKHKKNQILLMENKS